MRPLRLCMFGRTMPAHRGGKGMFHPYLVGRALAGRGHDVTILTTARADGVEQEQPRDNLRVLYLRGTPADRYSDEFWRESAATFDRLHGLGPFDAAWSDSAGAAGWTRLSSHRDEIPLVAACHAGLGMMVRDEARGFFATTHHAMLSRADAIIAVSRTVAGSMAAGLPGATDRIRVIPNGADPAAFRVSPDHVRALREALGLDGRPTLLYLGRVVPEKGGAELLRAVARLPDPRPQVVVVGPGAYGAELRAMAAALGVPFTLVSGVEHDLVPAYLTLADIFVLPTRHQEGLPFTLVEAMFCGRPIIASDIGGVAEVVEDSRTGVLVPPGDERSLGAAIERLLSDDALRARMGTAGLAAAHRTFGLDPMIDAIESLLRDVCAARRVCA